MQKISKVDVKQEDKCYLGFTIITKTVGIVEKKVTKEQNLLVFRTC